MLRQGSIKTTQLKLILILIELTQFKWPISLQLHINSIFLVSLSSLYLSIESPSHNITHYKLIQSSLYDLFHYSYRYLHEYNLPFSGLTLSISRREHSSLVAPRCSLAIGLSAFIFAHVFSSGKLSTEWQEEVSFPCLSSPFIGPTLSHQHSYHSCPTHPRK